MSFFPWSHSSWSGPFNVVSIVLGSQVLASRTHTWFPFCNSAICTFLRLCTRCILICLSMCEWGLDVKGIVGEYGVAHYWTTHVLWDGDKHQRPVTNLSTSTCTKYVHMISSSSTLHSYFSYHRFTELYDTLMPQT